jgi:hypothetical protein
MASYKSHKNCSHPNTRSGRIECRAKYEEPQRQVGVIMFESLIQKLDEFAAEHGLNRSGAVRLLVKEGLKRRNHETEQRKSPG